MSGIKQAADLFCGAGGTTSGLLRAAEKCGAKMDVMAINHWNLAIDTHLMNHPQVKHLCESLDGVDPRKLIPRAKLDILAASPECTHHSIARGGRPCADQSRASAWHVVRWAEAVSPERIVVENVKEFAEWGPLTRKGRPDKRKKGQTFLAFLQALDSLGYKVDHAVLNSADYGDATTRRRLFVQAWRNKRPTWPEASHAGRWKPAEAVIDWRLQGVSIYNRERPLSENTLKRIDAGMRQFSGLPFVMPIDHLSNGARGARPVSLPISTITTENRHALVQPWLISLRGTTDRHLNSTALPVTKPLPTITAGGGHIGLCTPFLTKFYGTGGARPVTEPLDTITTKDRFGLCQPVVKVNGEVFAVDVLFRMLQPHELKLAMGFDASYQFAGNKAEQVKQIGNAVSVATSEAIFLNIFKGGRL